MARARDIPRILGKTLGDFMDHDCANLAAALSFYAFYALPALVFLLVMLLGLLADPVAVQRELAGQIGAFMGPEGIAQVEVIFEYLTADDAYRPTGTIIGVLTLLFIATTGFASLQEAFNRIWSVDRDPSRGHLRIFLGKRLFSFVVILVIGLLVLLSLFLSTAVAAAGDAIAGLLFGWSRTVVWLIQVGLSLAMISGLFAAMFKWIPDVDVAWRDVWVGAVITAVLFVAGKEAIGAYLGGGDPGGAYGAAASLALLMLWVYYSSMVLLLGAELTRAWEEHFGRGVVPGRGAVRVVKERRDVRAG